MRDEQLEARDPAGHDRQRAAHRLEQHHAEARLEARRAEHVRRRVVARAIPVDAPGELDRALHLLGQPAQVVPPQRPVPDHAQADMAVPRAPHLLERLEHRAEAVARVEAPDEEDDRNAARRQRLDRLDVRAEVIVVDAVRDHAPVEVGEVVVERCDAGLGDDDVSVQPPQRGMGDGSDEIAHQSGREDRVVGADADRVGGQHGGDEHERARVVGRVHVHDIEASLREEPPQACDGRSGSRCATSASRCRRAAARRPCARSRLRRSRGRGRRGPSSAARAAGGR